MEIRFTASVIEAVKYVWRLSEGTLWVRLKGSTDPAARTKIEYPVWCNFHFFSRIKASPIRRTERMEPTQEKRGSWKLERAIEFFHHGSRVAVVDLVGQKIDGDHEDIDNDSFWAVTRIGYFRSFSGGLYDSPKDWREIELEVTALHGRLVA